MDFLGKEVATPSPVWILTCAAPNIRSSRVGLFVFSFSTFRRVAHWAFPEKLITFVPTQHELGGIVGEYHGKAGRMNGGSKGASAEMAAEAREASIFPNSSRV
eukprot:GHVU01192853.1.p1 GENE.GHVU01192853.1~~GHVU01192853.1.p1  ORF type:complete len:103 (+),score=5.83 GHVU01192853.1:133-441(+)